MKGPVTSLCSSIEGMESRRHLAGIELLIELSLDFPRLCQVDSPAIVGGRNESDFFI